MGVQYYNIHEFNKAVESQYSNPYEAKRLYEEYFNNYPNDYTSYPYFISVLISLGELEYAEKIYNFVKRKVDSDDKYKCDRAKYHYYEYGMFTSKLKLLFQAGRYQDALNLYNNNVRDFVNVELNDMHFYCMEKTGRLDPTRRDENSYLFRQIVEYKEEDFRDHIKKHLLLPDYDNQNESVFVEGFPIDKVIEEVRKYLPSEKRILSGFIADFYFFKYNDCGKDHFKVICFHNTNNIITMCPTDNGEYMPYVDLNYLKQEEKPKVKTLSQIDKFKKRYSQK